MMALVLALAAVRPNEFDAISNDTIDLADVNAVGANHFHMFFYSFKSGHV
jgi:hypothetical protein